MKTLSISALRIALLAMAFAAVASMANADSISYSTNVSSTQTDFSTQISLPLFNPALGILYSVTLTINGSGTTNITVSNPSTSSTSKLYGLETLVNLEVFDDATNGSIADDTEAMSALMGTMNPTHSSTPIATLAKCTSIVGGVCVAPPGAIYNTGNLPLSGTPVVDNSLDILYFIGPGNMLFDVDANALPEFAYSGGSDVVFQTTYVGGEISINYDYHTPAVPEPESLILFSTGLLGLYGAIRYKFMKSR